MADPPRVTGYVVAGGQSRRMGRDKALLPWGGGSLLDHAVARLRECCAEVRILCGPEPRYLDHGAPVDLDAAPGTGPLGALLTGLQRLPSGLGLFLAVDLPFVPVPLLRRLVELSEGHDAVAPVTGGKPHPLCGAYRPVCVGPIGRAMDRGDLRMTAFWPEVRVRELGHEELAAFGRPEHLLRNLNSARDYEESRP